MLAPRFELRPIRYRPNEKLSQYLTSIANIVILNQQVVSETDIDELRNALLPLDDKLLTQYISIDDLEYLKF